jgi:hypothetical protein
MSNTNRSIKRQRPAYEVYAAEQRRFKFWAFAFIAVWLIGGAFFVILRALGVL